MLNNMTGSVMSLELRPGQIVGILIRDKIFHIVLILALARIGVVTVSCRENSLPKELGAEAAIVDIPSTFANVNRIIRTNPEWLRGDAVIIPTDPRVTSANGHEICRLILTSGSTGSPKAVSLSHDNLLARADRFYYCLGDRWPNSLRLFCDVGLSTSLGFLLVFFKLMRGGLIYLYGEDGLGTLQSLDLFKIQNMITSPHNLNNYLKFFESHPYFRFNLDHIVVAGAKFTNVLAERVWARLCPNLINLYGATEIGTFASADVRTISQIPGAVGFIQPGAQAEIVGASGNVLSFSSEGAVRVRTRQIVSGYYGDPETSALRFRDGWFYPGDLGYIKDDGMLVITGRQELLLNSGGDKINPEIIEEVLKAYPGIQDAAVTTKESSSGIEEICALMTTVAPVDEARLKAFCSAKLLNSFVPSYFCIVDRIPRNEMGKIDRSSLHTLVASSKSSHSQMTH